MSWIFDSHIHLSDLEYQSDMPQIIKSMEKLKIKTCCVSMDYETSQKTLEISKISNLILPFIGVHPEMAQNDISKTFELIEKNHEEISGIGEIGLDRTYINSDDQWEKQIDVFKRQLELAEKFGKPISVHSRKTLEEIFEILSSYSIKQILLHWFDGRKSQLQKAMDLDYYVSFGPLLLYANDKQTLISKAERDKILIETDGPVRFSGCFGMKTAQITFLQSIIFCASKILGLKYNELECILEKNSLNYLGI